MRQIEPMVEQLPSNIAVAKLDGEVDEFLADAGYYSSANVDALANAGMNPFIPTQRLKHNEQIPDSRKAASRTICPRSNEWPGSGER